MNLIKCTLSDIEELITIGRTTYYDTFHSMNSPETMERYLDEAFDRQKITGELTNPKSSFYFLYDEDVLIGYKKINFYPAQSDINDPKSLELERIYVLSEYKGKGYGTFMIDKTVQLAKENKCTSIWLGVWEKNLKALSFYQKQGFEIAGKHPFRMGNEIQNDYILRKVI